MSLTRSELAATFLHEGVADAYQHRPPYPAEVFDLLTGLITDAPADVLDLGAGEGALARPLAARVHQVDALDVSAAMLAAGRARPGGDQPNLRWILGAAETAPLAGPYALVTAGASLHWMDPRPTLTRLAAVITEHAYLAIVDSYLDVPWQAELEPVLRSHSRNQNYDPEARLADKLAAEGLFEIAGTAETTPVPFTQPAEHYIEALHSTSSLAREHMPAAEAAELGQAIAAIAEPYATGGALRMPLVATLSWGKITSVG